MTTVLTEPPVTQPRSAAGPRRPFLRAVLLMLMTLVVPGSAHLAMGQRRVGRIALRVWLGVVGTVLALLALGAVFDSFVFWLLGSDLVLGLVRWTLILLAIGWGVLFVDTWRLGDPLRLRRKQRLAMVGINGLLCFTVAGSLLFAAHAVGVQRTFLSTVFADGHAVGAHDGRFNVLLLGGDAGEDREGMRPDSIQVASIDAETGQTVLVGLPRNLLNFPFPEGSVMAEQFPDGYDCGPECELNSLATWAVDHPDLFEGYADPGIEATMQGVEGVTGLQINYYAMVNMAGFEQLVDAVGGVELHVREDIPIGGGAAGQTGTITAGTRTLDGFETLWFARSRMSSDDYSRMARQKCVVDAMVRQLDPSTVLMNFQAIAEAGSDLVTTDLPRGEVDRFMRLALQARTQPIRTLSLVPPLVQTGNPDIDLVHREVDRAIAAAEEQASEAGEEQGETPAGEGPPKPRAVQKVPETAETTGGSVGSFREGYQANQAEDLSAVC